jgi:hypothetical protein
MPWLLSTEASLSSTYKDSVVKVSAVVLEELGKNKELSVSV